MAWSLKILLLAVIVTSLLATVALQVYTLVLRTRVLRSGRNGDLRRVSKWVWERESLRVVKQILLCAGVASTYFGFPPPPMGWSGVDLRDAVVAVVCALMGFVSVMDLLWFKRLAPKISRGDEPK